MNLKRAGNLGRRWSSSRQPLRILQKKAVQGARDIHAPCTQRLLQKLEYSLLRLVGLLQGSHAGGLQNVVLCHVRHRLAHVCVHD